MPITEQFNLVLVQYIITKWDKLESQSKAKTLVTGDGTQVIDNPALEKRAKRKTISRTMILSLIDVATAKGVTDKVKSYWNSWLCQNSVLIKDGVMYGDFCKNRFCTICTAIRKAENINKYYPTITKWEDIQFVTLTVKAQPAKNLNKWIDGMIRAFGRIKNRMKKRNERGEGPKFIGVKSLECNFNPDRRTYNPHFHIIMQGKECAEILKKEWCELWGSKHTYKGVQYIRPVKDLESDLIETIKYGSKIFTEADVKKKTKSNLPPIIYAKALHNIFMAMEKRRIFDRFGFNLPPSAPKRSTLKEITNFEKWVFPADGKDWINPETGESLTGFLETPELSYLLSECIDKELY